MKIRVIPVFNLFYALLLGALIIIPVAGLCSPTEVIQAYGSEFSLNGDSFSFVGVNLRGICHYGYGDILPYTSSGHIDENLGGVASMGGKVVRLFAPIATITHQHNVDRLKIVLDKMEPLGLKAIVCFTDVYPTGFNPQGDSGYYMMQPSGWTLLDDTWFASGYTINYLPLVQLAVTQLKDHNAVFAWELGNELTDIKNPSNIISFTSTVAAAIKAIDPDHMVTTGFIGIDHTQIGESSGIALYSDPNIDFITQHSYDGSDNVVNHAVHSKVGKPLVLEEYGWTDGSGDRVANTLTQMNRWIDERAARGFMQWGYQAQSWDIGDGDNTFGMDQYAHSDYSSLYSLYSTRAAALASGSYTLAVPMTPPGVNIATSCTGWDADSTFSSSYGGDKVYDGILSAASKWTSDGTAAPHWLALDLGSVQEISGFTIRMAGAGGENYNYAFKAFEIQSGGSLSGPWTTEFSVNNSAQFSNVHCLYDTPASMRYIRIYITDSGVDNYCRLPEFEIYSESTTNVEFWNEIR